MTKADVKIRNRDTNSNNHRPDSILSVVLYVQLHIAVSLAATRVWYLSLSL